MNKQLADHHLNTDVNKMSRKVNQDLDDLRSESSLMESQCSFMGRSGFSSAMKNP